MARVLVGVDASPASVEALHRAADEARWRNATLEVVYTFQPPQEVAAFPVPPASRSDREQAAKDAKKWLDGWLEEVGVELSELDVEAHVVADPKPSRAIIERSADADLVVVGSRGRGGFAGLRLGSTSEQVTRHAECPVLVVRSKAKDGKKAKKR